MPACQIMRKRIDGLFIAWSLSFNTSAFWELSVSWHLKPTTNQQMRREVLLVLKTLAKQILQEPEATVLQE